MQNQPSYQAWIGIDVSKKSLDATHLSLDGKARHRKFSNDPSGWREMLDWAKAGSDGHWAMESTGAYSFGVASFLADAGLAVSMENPRYIKHWACGMRYQNKTDKADSRIIARYAQEVRPKLWTLADPLLREIHMLLDRLADLSKLESAERNRLENAALPESVHASVLRSIVGIQHERELVVQALEQKLESRPELKEAMSALVLEPGVGELTALRALDFMGWSTEGFQSAQQVAAAAGYNPVRRESGDSRGKTSISKQGPAEFRAAMHMAAVVAIRRNPRIQAFYERLLAKGMAKLAAVAACARKLIMILYGILKAHQRGNKPVYSAQKIRYCDLRGRQRVLHPKKKTPKIPKAA